MNFIQDNYSREVSLDDVSGEVNISPYYFSKIFKEETGENFIEYLTRIRMEKAKELLKKPEISVKEAGVQSGYTDPNYFSRIFKKQTGMAIKCICYRIIQRTPSSFIRTVNLVLCHLLTAKSFHL